MKRLLSVFLNKESFKKVHIIWDVQSDSRKINISSLYNNLTNTRSNNLKFWQYTRKQLKILGLMFKCLFFSRKWHLRGAFNKFPDFFLKAFKVVVDSWKFTMLLLYILWDDWPIFMISGSNQQLQKELEYTLLKLDCHSWWILKMQSGLKKNDMQ